MENTALFGRPNGPPLREQGSRGSEAASGGAVPAPTREEDDDEGEADLDLTRYEERRNAHAVHPAGQPSSAAVAPPTSGHGGQLTLPAVPRGVPLSRQLVREICHVLEFDAVADVAELLASEVVTNAVRHARTDCLRVVVEVGRGGLTVSVADSDSRPPILRHAATDSQGGRGMHLLDVLADDWGVTEWPDGKAVWFSLSTTGPQPRDNGQPPTREQ